MVVSAGTRMALTLELMPSLISSSPSTTVDCRMVTERQPLLVLAAIVITGKPFSRKSSPSAKEILELF